MLRYPAKLTKDGTGYMVSFRDIPEALTCGADREEALDMASDCLLTAMDFYFEDRRPVPAPSEPIGDEVLVALPLSVSAKVYVLNALCEQRVSQAELARRMGTTKQEVTRITDLGHATKIDTLGRALAALGKELKVSVD